MKLIDTTVETNWLAITAVCVAALAAGAGIIYLASIDVNEGRMNSYHAPIPNDENGVLEFSYQPGDDVVVRGRVVEMDLAPMHIDGKGIITIEHEVNQRFSVLLEPRGLYLCDGAVELPIPQEGDVIEVSGRVQSGDAIYPCESEGHYIKIVHEEMEDPSPSPPPESREGGECIIVGCSGTICIDKDAYEADPFDTTCEWLSEYECFQQADCVRRDDGNCGWEPRDELQQCIAEKRSI